MSLARFVMARSTGAKVCPSCGRPTDTPFTPAEPDDNHAWRPAKEGVRKPADSPSVADLWAIYVERHVQKNVSAPETLDWSWKNLEGHFGRRKPAQIGQDHIDQYEDRRKRGVIGRRATSGTIRRELNALQACLNWCADPKRKILRHEDLPAFDLPAENAPNDRWLREDEIDRLKAAAAGPAGRRMSRGERFLWLALETAGRSEAIRELTWDRVDFETRTIDLNKPGRRRTKKRRAVVPISKALEPVLRRMHDERIGDMVLDSDAEVRKPLCTIAKRAGVVEVTPNVLRHTAATHMARRGVPLFLIAKVLGNSLAMEERVYAHHCPDDLRIAVDKISGPPEDQD
jgi:integrase